MSLSDTSAEAARIQTDIVRRMTPAQRLDVAMQMSDATREMALSRIRAENPGWTDWQVKRELLRLTLLPQPLPPGLP
jgi:Rv0078B-related antitoxin